MADRYGIACHLGAYAFVGEDLQQDGVGQAAIHADVGNVRPTVLSPYHLTWNLEELYFKKK